MPSGMTVFYIVHETIISYCHDPMLELNKHLVVYYSQKQSGVLTSIHWPSPPGTFQILKGKFSYFVIRFLNYMTKKNI